MIPPDTFDNLDTIAEKLIAQGHSEDLALEMAASKCEEIDEDPDNEQLHWD